MFFQTSAFGTGIDYFVCGRLDGRLWQAVWLNYDFLAPIAPERTVNRVDGNPPDFNVDGVADYLVTPRTTYPGEVTLAAVSGIDGTIIWQCTDDPGYWGLNREGFAADDLTGDGVPDVLFMVPPDRFSGLNLGLGYLKLFDGQTGSLVWNESFASLEQWIGPFGTLLPDFPVFPTSSLAQSDGEIAVGFGFRRTANAPLNHCLAFYDSATGALLDVAFPQDDLLPWRQESFDQEYPFDLLGDIDRDGFRELGAISLSPSGDRLFVVLGRQTLFLPSVGSLGELVQGDLLLPGASGMGFQVLASGQFAGHGGVHVGMWETALTNDRVFQTTLSRPIRGQIGPTGEAHFHFQIPQASSLSGRLFFLRAVMPDPANPADLWTQSTLEVLKIN
ncbi:MAG: hypothetical protein H8E31_05220 [Planctomycetes bacterium]|nr:hypothetical protein [Planctomycetota bacterium]